MISLCESSEPLAEMCVLMGGTVQWVAVLNNTRRSSVAQAFITLDAWWRNHLCAVNTQLHLKAKQNTEYLHSEMQVLTSVSLAKEAANICFV